MTPNNRPAAPPFSALVDKITQIGIERHRDAILANARRNAPFAAKSVKQIPPPAGAKRRSAIVLSAGPSIRRARTIERLRDSGYEGTIIAADGAYAACLRAGVIPDFVVTLDPHETRMVRWFGDPDYEAHIRDDDYFERQDLDVEARKNAIKRNLDDMALIDRHAAGTRAIVASSAPENVVARLRQAKFDAYWWNPLVDDPTKPGSITREIYDVLPLPCLTTGGTVGTAAWAFAVQILKPDVLAVAGMDLGYYPDTPITMTQTYYELLDMAGGDEERVKEFFTWMDFPLTGVTFMTDPTYFWYRKNFLHLARRSPRPTLNCTEGGTLFGDNIDCVSLDAFLAKAKETARG
ncbi:MAG: DUF115 domain-containing protein [Elusimicrobia bacterium]|nr:DUF115 domain-containing protein [Elusimicrobiota bacterium]